MSTFPVDPPVTPAASTPEAAGAANRRELSQEEIATLPLQALLVRAGHITLDQLADALRENVATGRSVEDIALSRGWLAADQLDALRAAKQSYSPSAPAAAPAPVAQAPVAHAPPRSAPAPVVEAYAPPPAPAPVVEAPAAPMPVYEAPAPPAPVVQAPPPAPAPAPAPVAEAPAPAPAPIVEAPAERRLGRSRHVGRRVPEPRGRRAHLGGPLRQPRRGRAACAEPDRVARSSGARRLAPLRRPARPPRRCRQRRSVSARRTLNPDERDAPLGACFPPKGDSGVRGNGDAVSTGEAMPGTTNSAAKGLLQ